MTHGAASRFERTVDIFFPNVKGMTLETELLFWDYKTVAAPVMATAALLCCIGAMLLVNAGLRKRLFPLFCCHFCLYLVRVGNSIKEKTQHLVL